MGTAIENKDIRKKYATAPDRLKHFEHDEEIVASFRSFVSPVPYAD